MKLLLAVDRKFIRLDQSVLTEGAIGAESGLRYLSSFDTVTVCGRVGDLGSRRAKQLTDVSNPRLSHVLLPDVKGLNGIKQIKSVRERLKEALVPESWTTL